MLSSSKLSCILLIGFGLVQYAFSYRCMNRNLISKFRAPHSRRSKNEQLDILVKGDNIFRTHSIGAGFLGTILVLFPQAYMSNNAITEFAYQSWGIFILAVSALCFQAPQLDSNSKVALSRVFCAMCSAETVLYSQELVSHGDMLNGGLFVATASSVLIFAALAAGYLISGNMKLNIGKIPTLNRTK